MNFEQLYRILGETTVQLRKMPHESKAGNGFEKVDCHFIVVGVDKEMAEKRREELLAVLREYPQPERLAGGPSYMEVGAVIGDQAKAFQLFALGKVLGLWDVITPAKMGITGAAADQMAGQGMVMITGLKADKVPK